MTGDDFLPSPRTPYLDKSKYISIDGLKEGEINPFAFSARIQTHKIDNPTYKEVVRCPEGERKLWDVDMVT